MFRVLLRLILVLVIVVGAAAFFLGYWGNSRLLHPNDTATTVGTAGHVDTERVPRRGGGGRRKDRGSGQQAEAARC